MKELSNLLHHISFPVLDIETSSEFYDSVFPAIGYRRVYSSDRFVGYGIEDNKDKFAIVKKGSVNVPTEGFHLAFSAPSQQAVDEFYDLAIKHGGSCNGSPGLREHYGPTYYAAFVIDPDGYRLEVVHK